MRGNQQSRWLSEHACFVLGRSRDAAQVAARDGWAARGEEAGEGDQLWIPWDLEAERALPARGGGSGTLCARLCDEKADAAATASL